MNTEKSQKRNLSAISIVVTLITMLPLLLSSCYVNSVTNNKPIFLDGVYDGYEYSSYYENLARRQLTIGDALRPNPEYSFLFAVRNEIGETSFASENAVYINVSFGYYKANIPDKLRKLDITENLIKFEIDIYLVNNLSDLVDFDSDGDLGFMFDTLTPVLTITDFYSASDRQFNEKYMCSIRDGENGKYIGFSHSTRITVPKDILFFPSENITAVAKVRQNSVRNTYEGYENYVMPWEAKISYEKEGNGVTFLNFSQKSKAPDYPSAGHERADELASYDSLCYNDGDLIVSTYGNTGSFNTVTVAKIGNTYYANYHINYSRDVSWDFRLILGSSQYVIKKNGVIYYKTNLYQTFWRVGQDGVNGVRDPEQLFNEATSYKLEKYRAYYEGKGEIFGEPYTCTYGAVGIVVNGVQWNNSWLKLYGIRNPSNSVFINYYADGWITTIHAEGYELSSMRIDYYPNLGWEYTQIDTSRIQTRPQ